MGAWLPRLHWLYAVLALFVALLPTSRSRSLGAVGLALVLVGTASESAGGYPAGESFTAINLILAGLGAALVAAAAVVSRSSPEPAAGALHHDARSYPDPMLLLGLTVSAVAPHLLLTGLGFVLVIVAAARRVLRRAHTAWFVPLLSGAALLGAAFFLLAAILGGDGGRMSGLAQGPLSPAAERLLVLLLGGVVLLLSGLPPLSRAPWGLALAPLSAILLIRIALPALPGGMLEWQPLAMLLLAGAGAGAAFRARWDVLAVAGGLATLWSGVAAAVLPGAVLVLSGWLIERARNAELGPVTLPRDRWAGLAGLVPALAALPALDAALHAQVLLSLIFPVAAASGFALEFARRSRVSNPPLY